MKSALPRNGKATAGIVSLVLAKLFEEAVGTSEKLLSRAMSMTRGLENKTCEEQVTK